MWNMEWEGWSRSKLRAYVIVSSVEYLHMALKAT